MTHFNPESLPQSEFLTSTEIQQHVASLGPIFDTLTETGNGHDAGAILETGRLSVRPYYLSDASMARVRSLQGLVYGDDGKVEAKMILTGRRPEEASHYTWQLTKYPVSQTEPTEDALRIAEKYLVPIARTWNALTQESKDLYLSGLVRERSEIARKSHQHTTGSIGRFVTRFSKA